MKIYLVLRTFSKAWGIAGARLGYVIGQQGIIDLISKWRPMYEVNALSTILGIKLIENPEIMKKNYVKQVLVAKDECRGFATILT